MPARAVLCPWCNAIEPVNIPLQTCTQFAAQIQRLAHIRSAAVVAVEIDSVLAARAQSNLRTYPTVKVIADNGALGHFGWAHA